jgi:hypothetical protein
MKKISGEQCTPLKVWQESKAHSLYVDFTIEEHQYRKFQIKKNMKCMDIEEQQA